MSIHATAPDGRSWEVWREWLGLPRWSRRGGSLQDAVDTATGLPYEMPIVDGDDVP